MLIILFLLQILIIIILVFLVFFLMRTKNKSKNTKNNENNKIKKEIDESLNSLNHNIVNQLSSKNIETANVFKNVTDTLDKKMSNQNIEQINVLRNTISSMESKIQKQNSDSEKYIKEIITRISHLDNIKEQMFDLNTNITTLEKVLNDKKARGTFGEIRLKQIFEATFGPEKKAIYEEQYTLSNGKRVDFILHGPYPLGNLPIDSKFPLENYQNIINAENETDLKVYKRNFKNDIKKHINDIANKYIIENETATQAIMFIPAESIFAHIHAFDEDIVQYSYEKRVWITSPSTFMAILNLILIIIKDMKRNDSYEEIFEEINKLKVEFNRYDTRWQSLNKSIEKLYKDTGDVNITAGKIIKKFDDIEQVNLKKEVE